MTELFSWVPLPYSSPPGHPFPIKFLALSAHVSPQMTHFRVLDKSPVSGPGRGPPSFNTCIIFEIWKYKGAHKCVLPACKAVSGLPQKKGSSLPVPSCQAPRPWLLPPASLACQPFLPHLLSPGFGPRCLGKKQFFEVAMWPASPAGFPPCDLTLLSKFHPLSSDYVSVFSIFQTLILSRYFLSLISGPALTFSQQSE